MATAKKAIVTKHSNTKAAAKKAPVKEPTPTAPAGDIVDQQLAHYREIRDFNITAEPSGESKKTTAQTALPFIIQKHAASHLHYDFRLGWNGVLKSWAVAKGPSYVVKDRRLAVQVEDHPMEYGGFEGIIPKGQYGGGTVMVWDQGTWAPQPGHEDIDAGLRDGALKFTLDGTKLHGKWTLIRMHDTPGGNGRWKNSGKPNWLLIKEHDDFERTPTDPCITDDSPNSAITGRSLDQIAAEEDHVWNSKETAKPGQAWHRQTSKPDNSTLETEQHTGNAKNSARAKPKVSSPIQKNSVILSEASQPDRKAQTENPSSRQSPISSKKLSSTNAALKTCLREPQPNFISPQLAIEATAPPATGDWLHELKLDGYRIQARKSGADIKLLTRKGLDWTHRMPAVAHAIAVVASENATFDGEVVVLGPDGNSNFADLQASFQNNEAHPLTYFAFDLLHLDGHSTRDLPLRERKALLTKILPKENDILRLSEHIEGTGESVFHHACELHAEGILSKRADAPYRSARSRDWLKSKCLREQEFVVAGYTLSSDGDDRIGSLLLGYYAPSEDSGAARPDSGTWAGKTSQPPAYTLIYAGRTGTGFTHKLKRDLLTQLKKISLSKPAFLSVPSDARRGAHWTKPELVAQVRFATWTAENLVRQAAFLGLREDKPAAEVTREQPTVAPKPKQQAASKTANSGAPTSSAVEQIDSKTSSKKSSYGPSALKSGPSTTSPGPPPPNPDPLPIRLTHPDKILDPESSLTKRQLADYYAAVAEYILPHIADRPLSLVRCPEGAGKPCFFQKHVNAMLPKGIGSVDVPDKKTGKPESYITLDHPAAFIGLAQMGVLEIHPWGSKNDDLEHPDRLILDLDPDESLSWITLCEAADDVRKRLKKAGLKSYLKLTGGKGLHIVAPIEPTLTWPELKDAAHRFVLAMERSNPRLYLTKMTKSARAGKIYLDYLRNERGATAVAPFSPRARPGAHVSLPLPWSALKEKKRPIFSVHDFADWQSRLHSDPWNTMISTQQRLEPKNVDAL
jgi:bifunctional non-homologous end joining protein LigD